MPHQLSMKAHEFLLLFEMKEHVDLFQEQASEQLDML
jgi:hypothetical protein